MLDNWAMAAGQHSDVHTTGVKPISRPHVNSGQILLSNEFATDPVQLFWVLELLGFQDCGRGL